MKIKLYTDGFIRYFFLILSSVALFIAFKIFSLALTQMKLKPFLGAIMFIWLAIFLIVYLFKNKIELNEYVLNVSCVKRDYKNRILPASDTISIPISNIQKVILCRSKNFGANKDATNTGYTAYTFISKTAEAFVPLICVNTIDNNCIYIGTKPFSKSGIKKLLIALKELHIQIEIQDGLL